MNTIHCIQWLWKTTQGLRARIALNGAMEVLHVCASMAFVWITKHLVDIATAQAEGSLTPSIVMMLGCMMIQILLGIFSTRITIYNTAKLRNTLRQRLFVRTMESTWTGKEKHHTGDVLNRMEEDVRLVTETICLAIPNTLTTIFQLIAAFSFLLILEAKLAWTLLFIMPIAIIMSKVYIKKMRKLTNEIRNTDSKVQSHIQEHLQHRILIRSMEQSTQSAGTLATLQDTLMNQEIQRTDFSLFSRTAVRIGFAAGYATTFLWGIFGLQNETITFGMMTAFLQLVMQVQRPVVDVSKQLPAFVHTLTSVDRLAELENLPQEEKGNAIPLKETIGIRMENIGFSYPDGTQEVINHFSHDFAPGSLTAIVGETGVGKSTLIRLMFALLLPQYGTITLYNKTQQHAATPLTRCNFVYVPQGNTLMSGTIKDNLLLGNPTATDQQIKEALHTAAADFVWTLPDTINTLCGEGGMGLSEGQAQRIAIARGLLHSGGILLLDEPTSALDGETRRTLMERLKALTKNKTVIIITHSKDMEMEACSVVSMEKRLLLPKLE